MTDDATTTDATVKDAPTTEPAKADAGKTFTQDQVNDLIAKEKGRFQSKYEGFDDLKAKATEFDELKASQQSELEKAQGKLTKAEQGKAEAEAKLLRYEVAAEKEVPAKLVPLLTASSKEDLEKQADLILENAKKPDADFDGGARPDAPKPQTPEQAHNEAVLGALGLTPNN